MPSESLPKRMILRHRDAIDRLFKEGKKVSGRFVYLLYLPLEPSAGIPAQAAFLCGKRTGNAVRRNYYKRVFRDVFRKNKPSFAGFQTLIVSHNNIVKSDLQQLQEDIIQTAKKMK